MKLRFFPGDAVMYDCSSWRDTGVDVEDDVGLVISVSFHGVERQPWMNVLWKDGIMGDIPQEHMNVQKQWEVDE